MKAKIYYGSFDSLETQINRDRASLRVDCHFNSNGNANYSLVEIKIGDMRSKQIGRRLAHETAKLLVEKLGEDNGIKELSAGERGWTIVNAMNCPVMIWEPCFVSSPVGATIVKTRRMLLHDAFLTTIKSFFGSDALIALVPGHAHKRTGDSGAPVCGGGTEAQYTEILSQELFSLINAIPGQLPETKKEVNYPMRAELAAQQFFGFFLDGKRQNYLNLGNDSSEGILVEIYVMYPSGQNDSFYETLMPFSIMQPGWFMNSHARPNYQGSVQISVKAVKEVAGQYQKIDKPFVAWDDCF